jgi:uncharacterized protein (DUF1684 family)
MTAGAATIDELALLDWKREIFALYAEVRAADDPRQAWDQWRRTRDRLFSDHPQSPLEADRRTGFGGLPHHPYEPDARVTAEVVPPRADDARDRDQHRVALPVPPVCGRTVRTRGRRSRARALLARRLWRRCVPALCRQDEGGTTYGAGRYLLDTIKGADLGSVDGRLVLDFNFAYNPSCAYNAVWTCPLAPPENRLGIEVAAGERAFAA